MKELVSLFIFLLLGLCGCSESDSLDSEDLGYLESLDLKDFTLVRSKGKSVFLGTRDSNASINERPVMESKFDYDFWIFDFVLWFLRKFSIVSLKKSEFLLIRPKYNYFLY